MNSRRALILFFIVAFVFGAISGYYAMQERLTPKPVDFLFSAVSLVLLYVWYYLDASEVKFRRTVRMGACIIAFIFFAIPVYLYRSRPAGAKLMAVLRFLGLTVLAVLAVVAGTVPVSLIPNGG